MLTRINKAMAKKDSGFTLIELLVVMIIIGILAAIAIPTFLSQRDKGREAGSKADVKALATEIESALTDGAGTAVAKTTVPNITGNATLDSQFTYSGTDYRFRVSPGQTVSYTIATTGAYCVDADHTSATARPWRVQQGAAAGANGLQQGSCP